MTAPATLDAFVDPQIAALLGLCKAALNANVPTQDPSTDPTVRSTFGWRVPRRLLTPASLPALLIYRKRETTDVEWAAKGVAYRVDVAFEYIMPAAPMERIAARWPALSNVWHELVRVVGAGRDPSFSANATVLRAAGWFDVDENKRTVDYDMPSGEGDVQPSFVGTQVLMHRQAFDTSALQDLISLDAMIQLIGLPDAEQPLVETIATAP